MMDMLSVPMLMSVAGVNKFNGAFASLVAPQFYMTRDTTQTDCTKEYEYSSNQSTRHMPPFVSEKV